MRESPGQRAKRLLNEDPCRFMAGLDAIVRDFNPAEATAIVVTIARRLGFSRDEAVPLLAYKFAALGMKPPTSKALAKAVQAVNEEMAR